MARREIKASMTRTRISRFFASMLSPTPYVRSGDRLIILSPFIRPGSLSEEGAIHPDSLATNKGCLLTRKENYRATDIRWSTNTSKRSDLTPCRRILWVLQPGSFDFDGSRCDTAHADSIPP